MSILSCKEYPVKDGEGGVRLDLFLVGREAQLSRSRIQSLIRDGHVLCNGAVCSSPKDVVREGDLILLNEPDAVPMDRIEPEDLPLEVLYEDEWLVVLNKAAGDVVHPGAGHATGTLVSALLHRFGRLSVIGGVERPGIVHRLDKETSGCLVIARNDIAHRSLSEQFAERDVAKTYLAVVDGIPRRRSGQIEAAIGRHPVHRQKMAISTRDNARDALTDWRVLATGDGKSLIECRPKTGRTHQIRVHLKSIGFPICGDAVYGSRGRYERHLLHAWKLEFNHPNDGRRVGFEAPIPADFPLVPVPPK